MARGRGKKQRWLPTQANIDSGVRVLDSSFKTVKVPGRRKWPQIGRKCGHAAINNLFGHQHEVVSLDAMTAIADRLNTAHKSTQFGNAQGDFHWTVVKAALHDVGYAMSKEVTVHGSQRDHMWLGVQPSGKFLVLGWHGNDGHWFAVDADVRLVIDSARAFTELSQAGVLRACSHGVAHVFRVTQHVPPLA